MSFAVVLNTPTTILVTTRGKQLANAHVVVCASSPQSTYQPWDWVSKQWCALIESVLGEACHVKLSVVCIFLHISQPYLTSSDSPTMLLPQDSTSSIWLVEEDEEFLEDGQNGKRLSQEKMQFWRQPKLLARHRARTPLSSVWLPMGRCDAPTWCLMLCLSKWLWVCGFEIISQPALMSDNSRDSAQEDLTRKTDPFHIFTHYLFRFFIIALISWEVWEKHILFPNGNLLPKVLEK